jgi:hypothetical protein
MLHSCSSTQDADLRIDSSRALQSQAKRGQRRVAASSRPHLLDLTDGGRPARLAQLPIDSICG